MPEPNPKPSVPAASPGWAPPQVPPLDREAMDAADVLQSRLTKPPGSMGRLERLGTWLAGVTAQSPPPLPTPVAVAVFAGDHGVVEQGVTAWPAEVTAQMVSAITGGRAVINALARQVGASVVVVDVGVATPLPESLNLLSANVSRATADFTKGPAMSREQALTAIDRGVRVASQLVDDGHRLLVTGELGIGNTTPAAALIAAFTGRGAAEVTGRGAGSDDVMLRHKVEVIESALATHQPDPQDPVGVLAAVGGFEHAALVGYLLGAAARRTPVVLDGVIACSAALVAQALVPGTTSYLVAGHRSSEPGASIALTALGLEPLLDLGLRLGEGSGAMLAVPLVQAAARLLHDVGTFEDAGIAG